MALNSVGQCIGLTELNEAKRNALRRRLACVIGHAPTPSIYIDNASLSLTPVLDEHSNVVGRPIADCLFCIVCADISRMTSTPKSLTDTDGSSGKSWCDCLAYLDELDFQQRPKAIILECVDNLSNMRDVGGRKERGTIIVKDALRERGYVGQWAKISATRFFLPKRRPRVWGLFLKMLGGVGPRAIERREQDLHKAFNLLKRCDLPAHESLKGVIDRVPPKAVIPPETPRGQKRPQTMTERHQKFITDNSLTQDFIQEGQQSFLDATKGMMQAREQATAWLNVFKWRRRTPTLNWQSEVLVLDCGSSVGWMSVARGLFPCVSPSKKCLLLIHGQP